MALFSRSSAEKRKHVRGLLRAAAYLAALSGVFTVVQVRQARAEVGDRTVELGRQMMALANATQHDVNKLLLNGQSMYIGSSVSSDSVATILDRYNGLCEENRAQPSEDWRTAADKADGKTARSSGVLAGAGIVRGGSDNEGAVVCFMKTPGSKQTFTEAVNTFAATGELGALGAVRYVYAHKTPRGNTVVLTAWTDDRFNLQRFMSEEGKDCEGEDFAGLPRPEGATRVVSGRVDKTPFGVNVYRSSAAPDAIARSYDEQLLGKGWIGIDPELDKLEATNAKHRPVGRIYEKDGVVLTVASHLEPDATFTSLGLAGVTGRLDDKNVTGTKSSAPSSR